MKHRDGNFSSAASIPLFSFSLSSSSLLKPPSFRFHPESVRCLGSIPSVLAADAFSALHSLTMVATASTPNQNQHTNSTVDANVNIKNETETSLQGEQGFCPSNSSLTPLDKADPLLPLNSSASFSQLKATSTNPKNTKNTKNKSKKNKKNQKNKNQNQNQNQHLFKIKPYEITSESLLMTKTQGCTFPGCGMRFAKIGNLTKHQLAHTGEKVHRCRVCRKIFANLEQLEIHVIAHRKISQPKGRHRKPKSINRKWVLVNSDSMASAASTHNQSNINEDLVESSNPSRIPEENLC